MYCRAAFQLYQFQAMRWLSGRSWRCRIWLYRAGLRMGRHAPSLYELFKIAWVWYIGMWTGSLLCYARTRTDLFGHEIGGTERMILWVLLIVGLVIAPIIAFDRVRIQRDQLRSQKHARRVVSRRLVIGINLREEDIASDDELDDWMPRVDRWGEVTVRVLAKRVGSEYSERFWSIGTASAADYLQAFNPEHSSCLLNLNLHLQALREIFDRLPN